MHAARVVRLWSYLACGGVAAALPACGMDLVDVGDVEEEADTSSESAAAEAQLACATTTSTSGFTNQAVQAASALSIVDLEVTPSGSMALDGVISLSSGAASSFNQLATSVRFSTSGVLDARDGAAYRADISHAFSLGSSRKIRIVSDLKSHTFSAFVNITGSPTTQRLAGRYAFRSTAATVPSLDRLAAKVDGASGQLSICNVVSTAPTAVAYVRDGAYGVVPLASDRVLISDGTGITMRLDPNGALLNQAAVGGELAADPSERVYVARVVGTTLAIDAFTSTLGARWSRSDPTIPGSRVLAMAADAAGVTVAVSRVSAPIAFLRFSESGGPPILLHSGGTHAAVGSDSFAVATASSGEYEVSLFTNDGKRRWTQYFGGAVGSTIEAMTLGLDGRVVLGGHYSSQITFGGERLDLAITPDGLNLSTYLVGLDRQTGAHVFTNQINASRLTSIAGNGARIAVVGERVIAPIFPHLWQYDASGAGVGGGGEPYTGFYEEWGRSGRVAISASNRIYWERSMVWPTPTSTPWPFLVAMRP
jgi:hypothetical protein